MATTKKETNIYSKRKIGFEPSEYQKKFFDFILHGEGNAVIEAIAGSGKTTTAVAAMKLIPKKEKCLFIAFNKSIAEELSKRLASYPNCTAKTVHALGLKMVYRNNTEETEIDEYKYRTYLKRNISELTTIDSSKVKLTKQQINDYIDSITCLINFGRLNLAQTPREMERVAEKYDIPYAFDECEVAVKCLEWGKKNPHTIDYTDMLWLPVELGMNPRGMQYDWVFVDECQDMSLLSIAFFQKCFKRGTRFVGIGDENQSINAFSGASPEAFQTMRDFPNTQLFELPISYRCAKVIVDRAKKWSPKMLAREDAPDGIIVEQCRVSDIKPGDMVLARTKAPLFSLYTKLLQKGINCYIKGNDIGLNLISLLDGISKTRLNADLKEDGVFVRLYEKLFNDRNKLMQKRGLDIIDASLSSTIIEQYDTINALLLLARGLTSKSQLIDRIEETFSEKTNSVCLSTVHKAKGLESENVYILCRSMMPNKRAEREWEKVQEQNIIYVAYTRAKEKLGFVSEKEVKPTGGMDDPMNILNDMRFCEKRICKILNRVLPNYDSNIELSKFNVQNTESIPEPYETENSMTAAELIAQTPLDVDDSILDELMDVFKKRQGN